MLKEDVSSEGKTHEMSPRSVSPQVIPEYVLCAVAVLSTLLWAVFQILL